jgi:hypothetical protein
VKDSTHTFTSGLKRIADFLYRSENINHKDVVYMNFTRDTGIFEDKSSGSHIYLEPVLKMDFQAARRLSMRRIMQMRIIDSL